MAVSDTATITRVRSRWVWFSVIPLGFGSWAPIVAAVRCRVWWWAVVGLIGPAVVVGAFLLAPHTNDASSQARGNAAFLLLVASWLWGVLASLWIRPAYRRIQAEAPYLRPEFPEPTVRARSLTAKYALIALAVTFLGTIAVGEFVRFVLDVHISVGPAVLLTDAILLAALVPIARRQGLSAVDLGLRPTASMRSLGLALGALFAYFLFSALWAILLIGRSESHEAGILSGTGHLSTLGTILAVVAVAISAPVVEEIFFRGLLYRSLRNRLPIAAAALLAGMLFGLVHIIGYPLITLPVKACFGVIACLLYERTGSILPGIGVHWFVDAFVIDVALTGNYYISLIAASVLIVGLIFRAALPTAGRPLTE